jgi:hypothetical protein
MPSRTIVHESYPRNSHWRCHFQYFGSAFINVFGAAETMSGGLWRPYCLGLGGFPAVWSPIGRSTRVVVAEESGAANFGFGAGADLWG